MPVVLLTEEVGFQDGKRRGRYPAAAHCRERLYLTKVSQHGNRQRVGHAV
jgi:hypothetical protein